MRGCYEEWREATTLMNAYDASLAGELSLLLASDIAGRHPKGTAAAWIAVGAAESFDEAKNSERATDARERAAEFYKNADVGEALVAGHGAIGGSLPVVAPHGRVSCAAGSRRRARGAVGLAVGEAAADRGIPLGGARSSPLAVARQRHAARVVDGHAVLVEVDVVAQVGQRGVR